MSYGQPNTSQLAEQIAIMKTADITNFLLAMHNDNAETVLRVVSVE